MQGRAVGWTGTFFILSQWEPERAREWLYFLNESPKTVERCIDVIDVEFTILPGQ